MTDGVDPQILALLGGDNSGLIGGKSGKNAANSADPDAFSRILDSQRGADAGAVARQAEGGSSLPPGGRESAAGGDSSAARSGSDRGSEAAPVDGPAGSVANASTDDTSERTGSRDGAAGNAVAGGDGAGRPNAGADGAQSRDSSTAALAAASLEGLTGKPGSGSSASAESSTATYANRALRADALPAATEAAISASENLRSRGLAAATPPADDATTGPQLASRSIDATPRGVEKLSDLPAAIAGQDATAPRTTGPITSEGGSLRDAGLPGGEGQLRDAASLKQVPERGGQPAGRVAAAQGQGDGTAATRADSALLAKLSAADGEAAPAQQSPSADAEAVRAQAELATAQSQLRRSQAANAASGGAALPDAEGESPEDSAIEPLRASLLVGESDPARGGRRAGPAEGAGAAAPINPRAAAQPGEEALSLRGSSTRNEARTGIEGAATLSGDTSGAAASRGGEGSLPTAVTAAAGPASAGVATNTTATASSAERLPEFNLSRAPQDPEFAGELTTRMKVLVRDGIREARINLHPAELGRLQVTVSTEGDQARVSFVAETSAAREAIEQSLPRLRDMLEQNGLQLAQSDVGQQGAQGRRDDGAEAGAVAASGATESDPAAQDDADTAGSVASSSRIDTYI